MAPIDPKDLSSNWRKLQKTLQSSKSISAAKPQPPLVEQKTSSNVLKRKRSSNVNGGHKDITFRPVNDAPKNSTGRPPYSRKRQKMEEPTSLSASPKYSSSRSLPHSVSMPSLRQSSLLATSKSASKSMSVLEPSADYPDIENDGLSSTALPGKYIALDCEMVGTGPVPDEDSALARVSVVNFHGHQVYDSYVQVKVDVTDYRTAISGIEPRHIRKDFARPFKEVHDTIKVLLQGRILVGHGLKNDLDALLLKHEKRYIRDTSKYSKFRKMSTVTGRTPSLKHLVETLLGVEFQTGAHSSVEDARATMALFRLEKEGFDTEIMKLYGSIKIQLPRTENKGIDEEVDDGSARRTNNNNRKKRKKKKH